MEAKVLSMFHAPLRWIGGLRLIDSDTTFKREFGALQAIGDAYPKYVISATPMLRSANHEGITHIHLRKFLSEGF